MFLTKHNCLGVTGLNITQEKNKMRHCAYPIRPFSLKALVPGGLSYLKEWYDPLVEKRKMEPTAKKWLFKMV